MILLIVPSRGRPKAAAEFVEAWRAATAGGSKVVFCLDSDDETWPEYPSPGNGIVHYSGPRRSMCGWTNHVATDASALEHLDADVFASLGDDHRVEPGFEYHVDKALAELGGHGIVYGDDGIHGENLATAAFVSRSVVDTLGYMVPPGIEHLYADNFWLTLGREAGCIRYVAEMRTPHLHPLLTTPDPSKWDALYQENNSEAAYARDGAAFDRWVAERMADDVAKVRALRGETAEVA